LILPALPASPGVSVIVNTLNRMGSLENTLHGLSQLRYSDVEVIVVHGPCTDETLRILERWRGTIRIASCPVENLSISRNIGLRLARKDLVAFIDDDAVPEPDWLDQLTAGFTGPAIAAVGGFIRDQGGVAFQHQLIIANRFGDARSAAPPEAPSGNGEYFSPTGTNVCLRRDCLAEIGGFDETFTYFLEETDVNLRLIERGWSIAYAPEAEVHHYFLENRIRSDSRVPRSLYQLARSKAYFCWKHGPAQYSVGEIERRLSRHRTQLRRQLLWFQATRRLSGPDARRLRTELDRGLADGSRAARAATEASRRSSASIAPAAAADAIPAVADAVGARARRSRRPRICWVLDEKGANAGETEALPQHMVGLGHEVTMIRPADGAGTTISFDGAWRHRIGMDPGRRTGIQPYGDAALREVERIQPRRQFDVLFCADGLQAALAPLADRGIRIVADPPRNARDFDASIRAALA
jgi:hypothetical protein